MWVSSIRYPAFLFSISATGSWSVLDRRVLCQPRYLPKVLLDSLTFNVWGQIPTWPDRAGRDSVGAGCVDQGLERAWSGPATPCMNLIMNCSFFQFWWLNGQGVRSSMVLPEGHEGISLNATLLIKVFLISFDPLLSYGYVMSGSFRSCKQRYTWDSPIHLASEWSTTLAHWANQLSIDFFAEVAPWYSTFHFDSKVLYFSSTGYFLWPLTITSSLVLHGVSWIITWIDQ